MGLDIHWPVPDLGAGQVLAQVVVAFPVSGGPDGAWGEAAAAVRTDVAEQGVDAVGAECALVGTDPRFDRIGRQQPVAILAGGPEFEHVISFLSQSS